MIEYILIGEGVLIMLLCWYISYLKRQVEKNIIQLNHDLNNLLKAKKQLEDAHCNIRKALENYYCATGDKHHD